VKRKQTDCLVVKAVGGVFKYGIQRYLDAAQAKKAKYGRGKAELTEFVELGSASTLDEAIKRNKMLSMKEKP